jgi:hypothetical protein
MNRHAILVLVLAGAVAASCAPKYVSGSTECSSKAECPTGYFCGNNGAGTRVCFKPCATQKCDSGFVCANDGANGVDVCIEKGTTTCQSSETYYCKQAGLCWTDSVACSTITNCGSLGVPDYRACSVSTLHPDCNGSCTTGTGGGGSTGGTGGSKTDAGVGGSIADAGAKDGAVAKDGPSAEVGSKDALVLCPTTCSSSQQCLGGQCCSTPAAGGECNHNPSCGCAAGKVCYPSDLTHAMACLTANNFTEGADCSSGSSCQAGLGCFDGLCQRYCNSNSDCPSVAGLQSCEATYWSDVDTVIPGVKICTRICDPAHPQNPTAPLLSCPAGFGCESTSDGISYCYKTSPLPAGSTCSDSADCSPGYYCAVKGACNKYCLTNADCTGGLTCRPATSTSKAGTFSVGYCG